MKHEKQKFHSLKVISNVDKKLYWSFLLLGTITLLPFNCIIVPVDYWLKYYEPYFLSAISLTDNIFNWVFVVIMLIFG